MTLSERKAEASAATIESEQTGQVGRSHPRGSGLGATVAVVSAAAVIVLGFEVNVKAHVFFTDLATQMVCFYVICVVESVPRFAMHPILGPAHPTLRADVGDMPGLPAGRVE